jgi:DNA-binding GntR family transcriptional regulator
MDILTKLVKRGVYHMARAEKLEEAVARLREQILRGEFGPRGILPTRSQLERELGVTHSTMNQVILQLQGEGLITGNGTRRLTATPPRRRVPWRDVPFMRFLREQGLDPIAEYIEIPQRLPMDRELATAFNVPEGTLAVTRKRRDGTAHMWYRLTTKTYLSELLDDETLQGMQQHNEYDTILDIKNKKGITAKFMTEDIIGRLATTYEQEILHISRTTPVQEITRTSYDVKGGRVLWLNRIIYVANIFVIHNEYEGEALWKEINA